ncbi:STAS domain-containing protein [Magnetofaba australis]|uniref:Putative anti-anti-sigma factor n=1 Tax=Magnetofaba australis IT-1 TaxID=1434232 RepID=A0A1Y2JZA0_9PROT|nr:STAS domain-containing protein [Magnetofaba australis]OSM00199.1 putative anti-anti-sigma factor [Magnetofaba australis IT-1]
MNTLHTAMTGDSLTISAGKSLDLDNYAAIKSLLHTHAHDHFAHCVVDLTATEQLASSGLGILLILKDELNANRFSLRVKNPNVAYTLDAANMHKQFDIAQIA